MLQLGVQAASAILYVLYTIVEGLATFLEYFFYFVVVIRIWLFIYKNYIISHDIWRGGPNTWAVVTGGTDGIGLEFVRQLAQKGYNILVLSRNQTKLDYVKKEIEDRHPGQKCRVLAVDFTRNDIYTDIQNELNDIGEEVHVLVNNVGITYPNATPARFTKIPGLNQFITDIVNANVLAATKMTALILPGMEKRERGIIINLSAALALSPAPFMALFSATKIYTDFLARGLAEEYREKNILVQSLMPVIVKTKMRKHYFDYKWLNDWIMPSPEVYVRSALKEVPKDVRTTGYFPHKCVAFVVHTINIISYIIGYDIMVQILFHFYQWHKRDIEAKEAKQSKGQSSGDVRTDETDREKKSQ